MKIAVLSSVGTGRNVHILRKEWEVYRQFIDTIICTISCRWNKKLVCRKARNLVIHSISHNLATRSADNKIRIYTPRSPNSATSPLIHKAYAINRVISFRWPALLSPICKTNSVVMVQSKSSFAYDSVLKRISCAHLQQRRNNSAWPMWKLLQ